MLEQLELPTVALRSLEKLDKEKLEHYILHTIYDVSGAAAGFKANGSLTMHEETWSFFINLRKNLLALHDKQSASIESIYQDYLDYRGSCIGVSNSNPENAALIRIAGLARLATKEHGEYLYTAWNKLTSDEKKILTKELNIHGAKGERAIFVGYGVAMLVNPQVSLKRLHGRVVNHEGLYIGLKYLAHAFKITRDLIGNDSSNKLFVAGCDSIARALSKNPLQLVKDNQITNRLEVTGRNERKISFQLVPIEPPKVEKLPLVASSVFAANDASQEERQTPNNKFI